MKSKRDLFNELKKNEFRVTIFGSARINKSDSIYKEVYNLAEMLGERGIDVVTGGGPGLMAAASFGHRKGSKKTGAHAIGLSIELPHEQKTNKGVQVEKKFKRFSNRLDNFMLFSNAIVVAPGGVGTMLEFFYSWQLMQAKHICNIPIILLGKQWHGLIDWLKKSPLRSRYFEKTDLNLLFLAKDSNEAIRVIDGAHKVFGREDENFCLNFKKYRL